MILEADRRNDQVRILPRMRDRPLLLVERREVLAVELEIEARRDRQQWSVAFGAGDDR